MNGLESRNLSLITLTIIAEICSNHYQISERKRRRTQGHQTMDLPLQINPLKVYQCQLPQQPRVKSSHRARRRSNKRVQPLRQKHRQLSSYPLRQRQSKRRLKSCKRRRKSRQQRRLLLLLLIASKERKMRNSTRWFLYRSDRL